MSNIKDWTTQAAKRIIDEPQPANADRIAAIIETFAKPWLKFLVKRKHQHVEEDSYYCCGACTCPCDDDHEHSVSCCVFDYHARKQGVCDCGADEWNAQLEGLGEGS